MEGWLAPEDLMPHRYRKHIVLTSLALCTLLGAAPAPKHSCAEIRTLYSPRMLRALRERLLLAYARSHERRAAEAIEAIRLHQRPDLSTPGLITLEPQENDDPRLKHLLAYVAMNCHLTLP